MTSAPPWSVRVLLLAAGLWTLAPLVPVVLGSFGRGWFWPDLVPDMNLSAYSYATEPVSGFLPALVTSAGVAAAVALLALAVGAPAGFAIARTRGRARRLAEGLLLAPAVVPGLAVAMGLHTLAIGTGLAGTATGVILVHLVSAAPYAVLVSGAVFTGLDPAQSAVARSLGAGPSDTLRRVVVPLVLPGLAAAGALAFLVSWSQVLTTQLAGAGRVVTLPLLLVQFTAAGRGDLAGVAAVATVLPAAVVLALAARPLARIGPEARRIPVP